MNVPISPHYKKHVPPHSSFTSEKSQMLPGFQLRLAGHQGRLCPEAAHHTSSLYHPSIAVTPLPSEALPVSSQAEVRGESCCHYTMSTRRVDTTLLEGAATGAVTPCPHQQKLSESWSWPSCINSRGVRSLVLSCNLPTKKALFL